MKKILKKYLEQRKIVNENFSVKEQNRSTTNALIYTIIVTIPLILVIVNLGIFFLSMMWILCIISIVLLNLVIWFYYLVTYKTLKEYNQNLECDYKTLILGDTVITGLILTIVAIIMMVILIPMYLL